jgi:phosphoribosylcarboxyaminoimidazole (NCAIR) mutase
MFDSFLKYQALVAVKFKELQATYGFAIVDGHRTPDEINVELRKRIESVLAGK